MFKKTTQKIFHGFKDDSVLPTKTPVHSFKDDVPAETPYPLCGKRDTESVLPTQTPVYSFKDDVPAATPDSLVEPARGATAQEKIKTISAQMFVEALVTRIFKKAKVSQYTANSKAVIMRLVERTWIEVQDVEFDPTTTKFGELNKAIFQDLCQKWGDVGMVLLAMEVEETELGNYIASSVKGHLIKQLKKPNTSCKFFSSVGKAITNICRRRDTVGKINCPMLLVNGHDDQSWPTVEYAEDIAKMMRAAGKEHLLTRIEYSDAGHLIEPPYSPHVRASMFIRNGTNRKAILLWGGQTKPHSDAQEDSWNKILAFLQHHLYSSHTLQVKM